MKDKILKIVVIINIVIIIVLQTLPFSYEINLWGVVVLVLFNILVLIFNKKLSKNKIILIISIGIYFFMMLAIPIYKLDNHEHIFDNTNTIKTTMPNGKII